MPFTVEVISDVICPWCYVGKRRLEAAIKASRQDVRVRWRPFQLNPDMPAEGMDRREYRTRKFGSWERSQALDAQLTDTAGMEGLTFALGRIARTPNTLDAHRLLWLADREGVQDGVAEALFRAYFTDGRDLSDRNTLLDVAASGGLDRGRAEGLLDADEGLAEVRAEEADGRKLGVNGVPFFVFNGRVAVSGAQPTDMLLAALNEAVQ